MPLGMDVGLSPGDFVLDGNPAPYPKRGGAPPDFRPKSIVAKRLHGSRCHLVRRRPTRHCVRCGPSYPRNRAHPPSPNFGPCLRCQMAGWMKTPLVKEVDLGPGDIVLDGVPAPAKGAQQPPLFGPCLLWPWSPISATAELLLCFFAFSQSAR